MTPGYEVYRDDLHLTCFALVDRVTGASAGLEIVPMYRRKMRLHRASQGRLRTAADGPRRDRPADRGADSPGAGCDARRAPPRLVVAVDVGWVRARRSGRQGFRPCRAGAERLHCDSGYFGRVHVEARMRGVLDVGQGPAVRSALVGGAQVRAAA